MVEVRGSAFSLEPQLAAIFDSNRAGELYEELRKLSQTVLTWQRTEESGSFQSTYSFCWVMRESETLNELEGLYEYELKYSGYLKIWQSR